MNWLASDTCEIDDFIALVEQSADLTDYPHAATIERGTVVYDSSALRAATVSPGGRRAVMSELASALLNGPGIVVFRGAFEQPVVDAASAAFFELIAKEKTNAIGGGDHFAKAGAMIGSGMRSRNWRYTTRRCSSTTTATISST